MFNRFWDLTEAAVISGSTSTIEKIHGSDLDFETWMEASSNCMNKKQALPELRSLSLRMNYECRSDLNTDRTPFSWFLRQSPKLEHLDLDLIYDESFRMPNLSSMFDQGQHQQKLRSLSLKGIRVGFNGFQRFLLSHNQTLSTLQLKDMVLQDDGDDDLLLQKAVLDDDTWIQMLRLMHTQLNLQAVSFGGFLDGPWNSWHVCEGANKIQGCCIIHGRDKDVLEVSSSSSDCLKDRGKFPEDVAHQVATLRPGLASLLSMHPILTRTQSTVIFHTMVLTRFKEPNSTLLMVTHRGIAPILGLKINES